MRRDTGTDDDALGVPEAGSKSLKPGFWLAWKDNLHATGVKLVKLPFHSSQAKGRRRYESEVDAVFASDKGLRALGS